MFPEKMKELRAREGISQAELASTLGVAQQTVASWETGKSSPNYATLTRIANYFRVTTDCLLGNAPQEAEENTSPRYYHDPEVAEIAQEMRDRPGMRTLFDASRNLSKESIEEVQRFIEFQLMKEGKL